MTNENSLMMMDEGDLSSLYSDHVSMHEDSSDTASIQRDLPGYNNRKSLVSGIELAPDPLPKINKRVSEIKLAPEMDTWIQALVKQPELTRDPTQMIHFFNTWCDSLFFDHHRELPLEQLLESLVFKRLGPAQAVALFYKTLKSTHYLSDRIQPDEAVRMMLHAVKTCGGKGALARLLMYMDTVFQTHMKQENEEEEKKKKENETSTTLTKSQRRRKRRQAKKEQPEASNTLREVPLSLPLAQTLVLSRTLERDVAHAVVRRQQHEIHLLQHDAQEKSWAMEKETLQLALLAKTKELEVCKEETRTKVRSLQRLVDKGVLDLAQEDEKELRDLEWTLAQKEEKIVEKDLIILDQLNELTFTTDRVKRLVQQLGKTPCPVCDRVLDPPSTAQTLVDSLHEAIHIVPSSSSIE